MTKQKWCVPTRDCTGVHMYYASSRNNIVYVRITIRVPQDRMDFSRFSKARFSKGLEQFCSTLLLHTVTIVQTLRMPCFSFLNECYTFAPNSKFHSRFSCGSYLASFPAPPLSFSMLHTEKRGRAWYLMSRDQTGHATRGVR